MAIGWAVVMSADKSALAQADQGELIDVKELRKEAAQRQRRIIYNDDGGQGKPFDTPEKFYEARLNQLVNTQVDSVFYCTGSTTMFTHLSQVAENYGDAIPENVDDVFARHLRNDVWALREAGHETLTLAAKFCRQNDIEIFFSLRMNDIHE